MTQLDVQTPDFAYDCPDDTSGLSTRVAIFADCAAVGQEIQDDLSGAGFRAVDGGGVASLLDGPMALLGDVVMIDCPFVDGERLAALARLDMQVARTGANLIVATSLESLDAVFGALDQCDPQILIDPSRGERIVAVGRVLAEIGNRRVREMTEDDRLNLLHLSRQVEEIAGKLDHLSHHRNPRAEGGADRLSDTVSGFSGPTPNPMLNYKRDAQSADVPAPDPHFVRKVIAARQARAKFFDADLFADPAWDMLLDLTAAEGEDERVSVTSLCIAAAVPATTGLRWIKQLVDCGVFERVCDPNDKRRAFIGLSAQSSKAMARYFAEVEVPLAQAA